LIYFIVEYNISSINFSPVNNDFFLNDTPGERSPLRLSCVSGWVSYNSFGFLFDLQAIPSICHPIFITGSIDSLGTFPTNRIKIMSTFLWLLGSLSFVCWMKKWSHHWEQVDSNQQASSLPSSEKATAGVHIPESNHILHGFGLFHWAFCCKIKPLLLRYNSVYESTI